MHGVNANEIDYEKLDLLGKIVLFTDLRIDRNTLPDGIYAYDLRHDDYGHGNICEIKSFVTVNHWGTILTDDPIPMSDGGCRLVNAEDYSYTGGYASLEYFLDSGQESGQDMQITP